MEPRKTDESPGVRSRASFGLILSSFIFLALLVLSIFIWPYPGENSSEKTQVSSDTTWERHYKKCIPKYTGAGLYYFDNRCSNDGPPIFQDLVNQFMKQHPNLALVTFASVNGGGNTYGYYVFFKDERSQ